MPSKVDPFHVERDAVYDNLTIASNLRMGNGAVLTMSPNGPQSNTAQNISAVLTSNNVISLTSFNMPLLGQLNLTVLPGAFSWTSGGTLTTITINNPFSTAIATGASIPTPFAVTLLDTDTGTIAGFGVVVALANGSFTLALTNNTGAAITSPAVLTFNVL